MNRRANHDLIEVAGEVQHQTEKAFLFFDGTKKVWLPKSQCEWDAESGEMTLPEWLGIEKGLI